MHKFVTIMTLNNLLMKNSFRYLLFLSAFFVGTCVSLLGELEKATPLEPTPKMRTETRYIVHCLEQLHYHSASIQALNVGDFLKNYMSDWDYQRLFFLESDLDGYKGMYATAMPTYLRQQGNLAPAFEIFHTYRDRVYDRANWVLKRLDQPFDFSSPTSFTPDRRKADWPKNMQEADVLWESRLKYELLNEILVNSQSTKKQEIITAEDIFAEEEFDENLLDPDVFNKRLEEAKDNLRKRYKRLWASLKDIEAFEVEEVFLSSLSHMYDPHSMFFSADSLEDFAMSIKNSLVGIGAVLTEEDGYVTVRDLLPGGPAEKSKVLKPTDKIVGVAQGNNGEMVDIIGMKLRKVVKLIRGKEGTMVKLLIQPGDGDPSQRKTITIVRDQIKLTANLAKAQVYEVPHPQNEGILLVGVIDLPTFYGGSESDDAESNTSHDVEELIIKLKAMGVQGIILDLRRNLGGLLQEAISLTGLFIPTGPVLQVRDTIGQTSEYTDNNPYIVWDGPLMVMVTRYSASASEIVAGALKNHNRALVVGDIGTHGKGTVQAVFEMDRSIFRPIARPKMGAAKITIQKWYLPDGSSTQAQGVASDIVLPSLNEFLPVKESDLPGALQWDSIEPLHFEFAQKMAQYKAPVTPYLVEYLTNLSRERQESLPEFDYLTRSIEWFRDKQDQKVYSLNFNERLNQRDEDAAFRDQLEEEIKFLKKSRFNSKEIVLDIAIKKKLEEEAQVASDVEVVSTEVSPENEKKEEEEDIFDVHMRESLRIMADWINYLESDSARISVAQMEQVEEVKE